MTPSRYQVADRVAHSETRNKKSNKNDDFQKHSLLLSAVMEIPQIQRTGLWPVPSDGTSATISGPIVELS
jgi:hypothetical protein